jgi:hypothetical protein
MNGNEQLNHQLVFEHLGLLQQTIVKLMLINYIIRNFMLTLYLTA